MYGGLNIKENRVIYVHGSVDPWHALGITHTKTKNNVAIYIEGNHYSLNNVYLFIDYIIIEFISLIFNK